MGSTPGNFLWQPHSHEACDSLMKRRRRCILGALQERHNRPRPVHLLQHPCIMPWAAKGYQEATDAGYEGSCRAAEVHGLRGQRIYPDITASRHEKTPNHTSQGKYLLSCSQHQPLTQALRPLLFDRPHAWNRKPFRKCCQAPGFQPPDYIAQHQWCQHAP